jgi:hypothetical protein
MFEYVSSQIQTLKGELYPNSSIDIAKNMNLELCPNLNYLMISISVNLMNEDIFNRIQIRTANINA